MARVTVPATSVTKYLTMHVEVTLTRVRWAKARLWLGVRLLQLAAWVIGCGMDFTSTVRHD